MAFSDAPQCQKTAKSTGERCKNPAVRGRPYCRLHGGKAGAPAGNSNAVTTGEHETICPPDLTEEEAVLVAAMPTDADSQTALLIRLTVLRMRRMMGRIQQLREEAGDLVAAETTEEHGGGSVAMSTERQRAALQLIMEIEESITRLQGQHRRLLTLRREVTGGAAADQQSEELLKEAVERATAQLEER